MLGSAAIHPEKMGKVAGVQNIWNMIGPVMRWEAVGESFLFWGNKANAAVVFLTEDIFRIKLFRGETPDLLTTVAVLPQRALDTLKLTVVETEDQVKIGTSSIELMVDKATMLFSVTNAEGRPLVHQTGVRWSPMGEMTAIFNSTEGTHFYGLGEKTSFLDKKGEKYTNWNTDVYAPHVPEIEALYQSIPFLIPMKEGRSYGLFLDNPGKSVFDMRTENDAYSIGCMTGSYDIYFINGPEMKEVVARYTLLTGRIQLPPKWAIGYHQSRYSYMNQQEVLELGRTFRAKNIPCDVIYLDIHYMDGYRVFSFDPINFPDPEAMIKELKDLGIRIVPIVDPGVKQDPRYSIYKEGVKEDHFVKRMEGDIYLGEVWPGMSGFPDFTEDRTAEWWGDKHKFYTDLGIEGIWNDMNEPALFNESKTMDLDVIHGNNGMPGTHEELHNLYGMLMSKATCEGLAKQLNGLRPFVLTRAGYAGIQRYAAVWTGDNRSFWEHMALAMPMVMNMGLSGLPFAGPDIGGFAHDASDQLLVRWMQMGVFFPYCRSHSSIGTVRQEPWSFGEKAEGIIRDYIGLRYRWMPYMYNLFEDATRTGLPILRPLILEYPHDPNVTNLSDQFLLGEDVMVAPVYRPDTDHRAVYLPEGSWMDYWSGEVIEGGRFILAHAPLEVLPIYVKSGAVIAEGPLKKFADEKVRGALQFSFYGAGSEAGMKSNITLYEDDGTSYAYTKGNCSELSVEALGQGDAVMLTWKYEGEFREDRSHLVFAFRNPGFTPKTVEGLNRISAMAMSQGAEGWMFDETCGDLIIQVADCADTDEGRLTILL